MKAFAIGVVMMAVVAVSAAIVLGQMDFSTATARTSPTASVRL